MTPGRLAHLKHKAGIQGALHLYHATEIIEALEKAHREVASVRRGWWSISPLLAVVAVGLLARWM